MTRRWTSTRLCNDCPNPYYARGLCETHYRRWRKGKHASAGELLPQLSLADRFQVKVKVGPIVRAELGSCEIWTAFCEPKRGYGRFQVGRDALLAHRVAWELEAGPIPEGKDVLHHCDNPPCVRFAHLYLGTDVENVFDRVSRGRSIYFSGEDNRSAHLTELQVIDIRKRYGTTAVTQKALAEEYGVTPAAIGRITRLQTWTHLLEGEAR